MKILLVAIISLVSSMSFAQTMTQGIIHVKDKIYYALTIHPEEGVDAFIASMEKEFGPYKVEDGVYRWKGIRKTELSQNKFTAELRKTEEGGESVVQLTFLSYAGKDMLKPKSEMQQRILDYFNARLGG